MPEKAEPTVKDNIEEDAEAQTDIKTAAAPAKNPKKSKVKADPTTESNKSIKEEHRAAAVPLVKGDDEVSIANLVAETSSSTVNQKKEKKRKAKALKESLKAASDAPAVKETDSVDA